MSKKYSTAYDLYRFFAHHNLNMHIRYYNEHKRLASNQVTEITRELGVGDVDPKCKRDLEFVKHVYLNSYTQHMIINAFLMMYSHFEECLTVTLRILVKSSSVKGNKTGLEGFKEKFRERCALRLTDGPRWAFLQDCSKIRNALLHAAGNISLLPEGKKLELESVINSNHHVDVANKRLVLHEQILEYFRNVIADFVDWLTDAIEKQQAKSGTGDSQVGSPAS